MGVAGSEKAIWHREAGILLDSKAQFLHCLIEAPHEKMPGAYDKQRRVADSDSRTETESCFSMLNRNIGLACPTRTITHVVMDEVSYLRNTEHRELLLSGLRMAAGES